VCSLLGFYAPIVSVCPSASHFRPTPEQRTFSGAVRMSRAHEATSEMQVYRFSSRFPGGQSHIGRMVD
jgi:hypothetical protein